MTPRIFSYLAVLLVCAVSSASATASSTFQLASKCNSTDSLLISAQSSIYLKNYKSNWTSNETRLSPCRVSFTATNETKSFLLRFDLIKPLCSLNESKISLEIKTSESFSMIDDVCGRFTGENFYTFRAAASSNYFEMTFTDHSAGLRASDPDYHLFQAISSITVTQFKNSSGESGCDDGFKCSQPAHICLNKALRCDAIVSCPDESDESDCAVVASNSTLLTTLVTNLPAQNATTTSSAPNTTANSLVITKPSKPADERRYDIFIGLLGVFLFVTLALVGIWLYGRRKRQWRDFLARLDNNTDWEYEQLEDGPAANAASISRTNVIFNMNDDAFDPNMAASYNNKSPNYANNTSRASATERTPVRP